MIIKSLRIEGFGCFADTIEIGDFSSRVNIIGAPNGTGKSTLMRALTMALVDGHRVRSEEMRVWRPWGRSLSPRITVEFGHCSVDYRLEKRFLDGAGSSLFRKEEGSWRAFMQNDDADEFLRKDILNCTPPGTGLAKPQHWGIAQMLWTLQGDAKLPELPANVIAAVHESVGATVLSSGAATQQRIEQRYREFYTPGRGTLRTGRNEAPLAGLLRRCEQLVAAKQTAEDQLKQFDELSEQVQNLRIQIAGLQSRRTELEQEHRDLADASKTYETLCASRKEFAERKRAAESEYRILRNRVDAIQAKEKLIGGVRAELARCQERLPVLETRLQHQREILEQARLALTRAHAEEENAVRQREQAHRAQEWTAARKRAAELSDRLKAVEKIDETIAALTKALKTCVAPTKRDLLEVERAANAERELLQKLSLASVSVQIEPACSGAIVVREGAQTGAIDLIPGAPATLQGAPNLAFEIPGFGRVSVVGPVTNFEELRQELENVRRTLQKFAQAFGTHHPGKLRELFELRSQTENEIAKQHAARAGLLGDSTPDRLTAQIEALRTRVQRLEADRCDWSANPPDAVQLEQAAETQLRTVRTQRAECENAFRRSQVGFTTMERELAEARIEVKNKAEELDRAEEELRSLRSDGLSDLDRKSALDRAALDSHTARLLSEQIDRKVEQFGPDPSPRLALVHGEIERLRTETGQKEADRVRAETRLMDLGARSPYEQLATITEELSSLQASVQREERRMNAVKLLYRVMEQVKQEFRQDIASPVEGAATALLERICGPQAVQVKLATDFRLHEVVPPALAKTGVGVELKRLSGGEAEQVHICTRLALAQEIGKREQQFCIFDDILTFTDAERMARICEIFAEFSQSMQLFILTCHPERFQSIGDARFIDLESLVRTPPLVAS